MFPETKEEVLKLAYDCSKSLKEATSLLADRSSSRIKELRHEPRATDRRVEGEDE